MNTEKGTMGYARETHPVYSKSKAVILQVLLDVAIISHLFQSIIKFLFDCIVPFPKQLQMRSNLEETTIEDEENIKGECEGLFPSITKTSLSGKVEEKSLPENPQPCSTGLTTRLLPFKNEKGEIEWTFTDDIVPGTELDCFKMAPAVDNSSNNSNPLVKHEHKQEQEHEHEHNKLENNLSPTSSNSSNNDSILSNEKNKKKEKEETPMTSNSSPFSSSDHDEYKSKSDDDTENKTYHCPHCDAVFKIRGYLTRHVKKHAINKAYSCPFHKFSIYMDENNITHKCHPTGGFSRRDTYKTHLKSRHFKYPDGVKTKDRASSPGNCSMCGEHFQNSEIWCEIHIEGSECKFLPVGFKGKSIIKNRLKKQLSKQRSKKLEGIESSKLFQTPTSNPSQTPAPLDNMSYEYNNSESPSHSTSSGNITSTNTTTNDVSPGTNVENGGTPIYYNQLFQLPSSHTQQSQQRQQQHEHEAEHQQEHQNEYQQHPHPGQFNQQHEYYMFDQFRPSKNDFHDPQLMYEDYDDEFCLDVDQLNKSAFNNYNEILSYVPQNNNHPYQQHVHY